MKNQFFFETVILKQMCHPMKEEITVKLLLFLVLFAKIYARKLTPRKITPRCKLTQCKLTPKGAMMVFQLR